MRNVFALSVLGRFAAVASSLFGVAFSAGAVPMFQGLGDLPGGGFNSEAYAIAADGSAVVGQSKGDFPLSEWEAFRWTSDAGMTGLGDLPGDRQGS